VIIVKLVSLAIGLVGARYLARGMEGAFSGKMEAGLWVGGTVFIEGARARIVGWCYVFMGIGAIIVGIKGVFF